MLCPKCNTKTRVTDSRCEIMRRRKCLNDKCGHTFNTKETIFNGSVYGKPKRNVKPDEKLLIRVMSSEEEAPQKSPLVRAAEARHAVEDMRERATYTPPARNFGLR